MKRKTRRKNPMPKGVAVILLVAGIILGSIFTFGVNYWNAQIELEDAIHTVATFDSYNERYSRHKTRGIDIYFSDGSQLYIDVACVNDELREKLDDLSPGTKVSLMIHPNADTILDMKTDTHNILDFDNTQEKLRNESKEFLFLGIFLYICAIYAAGSLVTDFIRTRKYKKNA